MKKLVRQLMYSLLTGICFGLAAGAAFTLTLYWNEDSYSWEDWETIELPEGIIVTERNFVPNAQILTLKGKVENATNLAWEIVEISAEIFAGDALVNRCAVKVTEFRPGEIREFRITCAHTTGFNLPENLNYKVTVEYASRISRT